MTPTRPLAGPGNGKGAKGSNISNPSRHGTPAPSATDNIGISEQGRAAHMPLHTCRCTHAAAHMPTGGGAEIIPACHRFLTQTILPRVDNSRASLPTVS